MDEEKDICPTIISALLLRLHKLETNSQDAVFDSLQLLNWWVEKLEKPKAEDDWLDVQHWRLLARHIHALVAVNVPCIADAVAYDLGIESSLITQPQSKTYAQSMPFLGFATWQRPLKLTRGAVCDDDFDPDEDLSNHSVMGFEVHPSVQLHQRMEV